MAKPGLLVDSGALIALANRRETANQAVNGVLGDFFGELVTTVPAFVDTNVAVYAPGRNRPNVIVSPSGVKLSWEY